MLNVPTPVHDGTAVGQEASPFDQDLAVLDPAVHAAIEAELGRQRGTLEMIASENFAPPAILQAQGSILTNKYSEGYPGRRYYGGCAHVDEIERLAIVRARSLFRAEHANVQPHSGAQANAAALTALAEPGDTILGLELSHGGHLTHGTSMNFSGRLYDAVAYHVHRTTGLLDLDEVEYLARRHRPRVIIAGCSAYPRVIDWAAFRRIADEVEAALLIDMAHMTGLVAAGLHPSPVQYADIVTATTHKTLGGARGGLILARAEHATAVDSAVFPGIQGGALNQVIAAKAVTFLLAGLPEFVDRQRRTLEGAQLIATRLCQADAARAGIAVLTGGTDTHMVLLDLREAAALGGPGDGREAENRLYEAGITANRNTIPFDPRPALRASGLRLGTAALAARGFDAVGFEAVAQIVLEGLLPGASSAVLAHLRVQVEQLAAAYPLYPSRH